MSEMKERLIKAVNRVRFHWNDDEAIVSEVLKELREPTDAMVKSYNNVACEGFSPESSFSFSAWNAAIDEALK